MSRVASTIRLCTVRTCDGRLRDVHLDKQMGELQLCAIEIEREKQRGA